MNEELTPPPDKSLLLKLKTILGWVAVIGFICQIVIYPILTILSSKYGWGLVCPNLELGTLAGFLQCIF